MDSGKDSRPYSMASSVCSSTLWPSSPSTIDHEKGLAAGSDSLAAEETPSPPPDGGFRAWFQVFGAHLVILNSWGMINSFAIWQNYYRSFLNTPPSAISWIGSMQLFLLFLIGTFSGRALDAGKFHHIVIPASVLQITCVFLTSFSTKYWQILLTHGVGLGISNGMMFCPTVGLVSTYFHKRKAIAIGLSACGSATGGIIMPLMAQHLLPKLGFAWTMRVFGLVMTVSIVCANLILRPRLPPRKSGGIVDLAAFKELSYTLYALSSILFFFGIYFVFFYLSDYAVRNAGLSRATSFNLLIVMNGVSFIGRIIPNYLADKVGCLNLLIPCTFVSGIMILVWNSVHTTPELYGFAVVYGFAAAGIQSLFPASMASLTTDMSKIGVRMGMVFTLVSFTTLTGPPIAGALIEQMNGKYWHAQIFSGCVVIVSAVVLVAARFCRTGLVFFAKA